MKVHFPMQLKSTLMATAALATLLSMTLTASAAMPNAPLSGASSIPIASVGKAPSSACTTLKATDVYWATLADSGDIDQKVDGYPDGTTKIVAAFDYNCIPKKTKMSIVWSIDGEQALTDSATPKASDKASTYTYSLFKKDESALSNGDYGVEFYLGDTLLTTGKVTVGDINVKDVTTDTTKTTNSSASAEVNIQGTVVDSKNKKPINGALLIVLNEGVDPKAWLKNGKDEDILAFAKTDGKGQFALNNPVPTSLALPWIIGAKGYKTIMQSNFVIEESTDDPYIMNINLERSK
jgi:hypothetical protein